MSEEAHPRVLDGGHASIDPAKKGPWARGAWLKKEDELLLNIVRSQTSTDWVELSESVHTRSQKQCRKRYLQNLNPDSGYSSFNPSPQSISDLSELQSHDPTPLTDFCGDGFHIQERQSQQQDGSSSGSLQDSLCSNGDWDVVFDLFEACAPTYSGRQLPTRETGIVAPHNDQFDIPYLEQPKSRSHNREISAANASDNPVTVPAHGDGVSNGPNKNRKRKSRLLKPRKPRVLTNKGKAHAKAVRDLPGGACADCRRKKTKCLHRLTNSPIPEYGSDTRTESDSSDNPPSPSPENDTWLTLAYAKHQMMVSLMRDVYAIFNPQWEAYLRSRTGSQAASTGASSQNSSSRTPSSTAGGKRRMQNRGSSPPTPTTRKRRKLNPQDPETVVKNACLLASSINTTHRNIALTETPVRNIDHVRDPDSPKSRNSSELILQLRINVLRVSD